MLRNLKRALLGLGLAGLPLAAAAQEKKPAASAPPTWVESRFHRVHLKNGNFIDGDLIRNDKRLVVLKLKAGDFGIRADMINRVEYMKVRGLAEAPAIVAFRKEEAPDGPPVVVDAARPEAPATPVLPAAESSKGLARELSADAPERRRAKLQELLDSKGPEFVAALLEHVKTDARYDIVMLLVNKAAAGAMPTLIKLLKSPVAAVREQALKGVMGLGATEHLPQVAFCLADSDPLVRAQAIMVYQKLGAADDFDAVAAMMGDRDPSVRGTAIAALQAMAKRLDLKAELAETFRQAVDDAEPDTAGALVRAMGLIGNKELGPALAKYAESEVPIVRAEAIAGLCATDPVLAGEVIVARFEDETEYVARIQLSEGARKLRLKAAIGPLIEWLKDEDVNIQSSATSALKAITGQAYGLDHDRWAEWWELAKPKK